MLIVLIKSVRTFTEFVSSRTVWSELSRFVCHVHCTLLTEHSAPVALHVPMKIIRNEMVWHKLWS